MPYVIFTANGEEYDRRELTRPLVLGRAPECDVSIPDITLSRRHCRLEPSENGRSWQLVDLQSKNGTHFLGQKVECHVFRDRDELRIGRTRLTFRAGEFVSSNKVKSRGVIRPTDPHEALAGTVTGMVLCEPGETEKYEGMPVPQPRPLDPASFQKDDVYGMINEIASSSWDSIQAQASKPTQMQRAMPVPTAAARTPVRPKPRVSFALQADHEEKPATPARPASPIASSITPPEVQPVTTIVTSADAPTEVIAETAWKTIEAPAAEPAAAGVPAAVEVKPPAGQPTKKLARWRVTPAQMQKGLIALGSAAAIAVLFIGWCTLLIHATRDSGTTTTPATPPPVAQPATPPAAESPTAAPAVDEPAAAEKAAASIFPFAEPY